MIYALINFFQGLEFLVPEEVNLKIIKEACKQHTLSLNSILKIPEQYFETRPIFQPLINVHNQDLTISAQKRTDSYYSIVSISNIPSPSTIKDNENHHSDDGGQCPTLKKFDYSLP